MELIVLLFLSFIHRVLSSGCVIRNDPKSGLRMADCSRQVLSVVPQDLPTDIGILDLTENVISRLSNQSFIYYSNLEELRLKNNKLGEGGFEDACFGHLVNLRVLQLSQNDLSIKKILASKLFQHLTSLHTLDLRRNMPIADRTKEDYFYDSKAVSSLKQLSNFYVDMARVPVFSSGFRILRNIRVLSFDFCHLEDMKNSTFQNFSESLRELHLMRCSLIKIVNYGFLSPFPNLKVLNLADSHIHLSRALHLLYPLRNSRMNVINFQRVSHTEDDTEQLPYALVVTREMMKYLRTICVKTLNLADNGIVDFQENSLLTYDYPECFVNFVISSNRFIIHNQKKIIQTLHFIHGLKNIKLFDFSYVLIQFINETYLPIPNGAMSPKLDDLSCFSHYNINVTITLPSTIETMRFTHFYSKSCAFNLVIKNAASVRHLDMSFFQLLKFPDIYIEGENNLQSLNMSGIDSSLYPTDKDSIPLFRNVRRAIFTHAKLYKSIQKSSHLFQFIPSVEQLDISDNYLGFLYPDSFLHNSNLTDLKLSNNLFTEIPVAITYIHRLTKLNMKHNHLLGINDTIRDWLDSLTHTGNITLLLSGNVFSCSCENREFIRWLFNTNVKLDKMGNYSCQLSNGTKMSTYDVYMAFHEIFADCESAIWLRVGIVLLVTFTVILLPATIIFNFRWRITYWIYRKFKMVVETKMNLTFKYDAYISYADDASYWVKYTLVPELENHLGLSLCIEDRDFLGGHSHADTIAKCINASRQIVFVMTPELMNRAWTTFEIERANYEKVHAHLQITVINRGVATDNVSSAFSSIWHDVCLIDMSQEDVALIQWEKLQTRLLLNR